MAGRYFQRIDQPLKTREEHCRAIIEPPQIERAEIDIEALCASLDPTEKPDLVDFGPPAGSEAW